MNLRSETGNIDEKTMKTILIAGIVILNLIFWGIIFLAYSSKADIHDTTNSAQMTLGLMTDNAQFIEFEGSGKSGKTIKTLKNTVNMYNKNNYHDIILKCPSNIADDKKYTVRIKYSWFGSIERITVKVEY